MVGLYYVYRQWWYCISHIHQVNWVSGGICISSIIILAFCKYLNKRYLFLHSSLITKRNKYECRKRNQKKFEVYRQLVIICASIKLQSFLLFFFFDFVDFFNFFRYFKRIPLPGPLLIVILFTSISAALDLKTSSNIKVVGVVPKGFPSAQAPTFSTSLAVLSAHL